MNNYEDIGTEKTGQGSSYTSSHKIVKAAWEDGLHADAFGIKAVSLQ
jgi:hypothetical protein